jgi:hypothetical protein
MIETATIKNEWENREATDSVFPIKREGILARIMENFVETGILLPAETREYRDSFSRYNWYELLQILDESNRQRISCD